ncbi:MAG: S8 family serine peptidase [Candidatus Marinimicrobia bacterium]|nr:S8 family serine peptidase [Candidatus Neomarinimicrobiota bacterium]
MRKILTMGILCLSFTFAVDNIWIDHDGTTISANKLIIKFKPEVSPLLGSESPLTLTSRSEFADAVSAYPVAEFKPLFGDYEMFSSLHYEHHLHQYYSIEFSEAVDPIAVRSALNELLDVDVVDLNYLVRPTFVPNDNYYPNQWAHDNTGQAQSYGGGQVGTPDCDMDTDEAWDITTGSEDVIVAVLDTGVNDHDEFGTRLLDGWNFYDGNSNTADVFGHGTMCAGIVSAQGDNNIGVAGISWDSKILPVKVLSNSGNGDQGILANGIVYASDNGANVISMSLRWTSPDNSCSDAIDYATANGTVVLAATGNEESSTIGYPSAYENCIAVGALSPCNERKSYSSCDGENFWGSNYGTGMDFLSPGVRIHTVNNNGGYMTDFNGTSSACPSAAGVAALVLSVNPDLTPVEVRQIMQSTTVDLYDAGWDAQSGWGRINALNAVNMAIELNCGTNNILGDTNLDGDVNVIDIVIVANLITGVLLEPDYCQEWAANVNEDDIINILDIILIINMIVGVE